MRVRFWGTRGSMPVALTAADVRDKLAQALVAAGGRRFESFGAAYDFAQRELPFALTHTFGGHSSCVELETGSNEYFVCDMGSGARPFGAHVLARQGGRPATVNVFMSHVHWDHIMGFPFFGPAYVPGTTIRIHGCHDILEQALRLQQAPPCFPVPFDQLAAKIEFVKLVPGETYAAGGISVTPKIQRHSGDSYGYRFEAGGKVLIYSTDSEHKLENRGEAEAFVAFFRDADLVVFDAMYSLAEVASVKADWGHSSNIVGVELCQMAGVKHLVLFHHVRSSAPAVIVDIDERSLDTLGQWPWPRSVTADLVRAISRAGPAAIGVDVLFVEPDRSVAGADAALAQAVQGGKVVLGIAGIDYRDRRFPRPPHVAPVLSSGRRELPLQQFDGQLQSRREIDRVAAGRGLISADSPDRILRRIPLVARIGKVIVPALAVEMIRIATGTQELRIDDRGGEHVDLNVGPASIPIQSDGTLNVYFGRHDAQRFVPAEDVLSGKAAAELFRDKFVLVGVSGLGLLDFQATPLGERIPGVEVHAQILEQIFDGTYLRRPTGAAWAEAALLAGVGVLFVLFVPAVRPWISFALLAAALLALAAAGILAFTTGLLLNVTAPALAALPVFPALLRATFAEADRQRRRVRDAQARVAGELEAARRIQMGLLPVPRTIFAGQTGFALDALLEPARMVGGDFYDCFMVDKDRLFLVVGDV